MIGNTVRLHMIDCVADVIGVCPHFRIVDQINRVIRIGNSEISCHTWYITVPYNVVFRIDQVIELGRGRCEVNRAIERALQ